jgi:hypothetical protein
MASESLQSLLAWMKDTTRLWGWDSIVAVSGKAVNEGLLTVYSDRLLESGDQPVPGGEFDIPETDLTVYLQDVVLGAPVLSFEQASLNSDDLYLTVPLLTGREVLLKAETAGKTIQRIALYDPVNAPPLAIELKLATERNRVELDLSRSTEVRFLFGTALAQQLEGGRFFKRWFEDAANRHRTFAVAVFADQGNPLMQVRRVDVRTQSDKAVSGAARQALLLFVTQEHGVTGAIPDNEDPDFKYLIPNDADPQFSAAAMFSVHLQHRAAFGHAVKQVLQEPEFDYTPDTSGLLKAMVATQGTMQIPARNYQSATYAFESEAFTVAAASQGSPLTLEFGPHLATLSWTFPATLSFRYRKLPGGQWESRTAAFEARLRYEFHLTADESGASAMEGHVFTPYDHTEEVVLISGLAAEAGEELREILGFVGQALKRALLEKMAETLTTTETDAFLALSDFGSRRLHHSVMALPFDLALFGNVGSSPASFDIVEQRPLLTAGARQQFTSSPVVPGLRWSVESLPGNSGNPGTIDEQSGLYRAPPAHALGGLLNRVAVVATHPDTGDYASTPVTVFAHDVVIQPLLHVCNHGEQVELSAAGLGTESLTWRVSNPVPGESGELISGSDPQHRFYVAHGKVPDKTFVFDRIEVTTGQPGQSALACMVVLQSAQTLSVSPLEAAGGQIQLQARVNQTLVAAQWSLPFGGPGSIDANGVYTAAPAAKDLFVVVTARFDHEVIGRLEGYLVLPLPLSETADLIRILAHQ